MEEKQNSLVWLEEEGKNIKQVVEYEKLPALKIEENVLVEFTVDFSKPFEKWEDKETGTLKKIIPVMHNGERKVFWLNVANPLYKHIITFGIAGQTVFKVMRTGKAKDTKYNIIKN